MRATHHFWLDRSLAAYQRQIQAVIQRHEQKIRRIWEYLLNQSGNRHLEA